MKKICTAVVILTLCFILTACGGTYEDFDNDTVIAEGGSFSSTISVATTTQSEYTFSAKKCNGVKEIKDITVPENPVFDLNLEINAGRFKVVLVKDKEVFLICDKNNTERIQTDFAAGKYSLRIVAQDAKVKLTLSLDSYNL